jgi:hypothetical protein
MEAKKDQVQTVTEETKVIKVSLDLVKDEKLLKEKTEAYTKRAKVTQSGVSGVWKRNKIYNAKNKRQKSLVNKCRDRQDDEVNAMNEALKTKDAKKIQIAFENLYIFSKDYLIDLENFARPTRENFSDIENAYNFMNKQLK